MFFKRRPCLNIFFTFINKHFWVDFIIFFLSLLIYLYVYDFFICINGTVVVRVNVINYSIFMYYIENIKQILLYKTQGARYKNLAWGPVRYLLRHWSVLLKKLCQLINKSFNEIKTSLLNSFQFPNNEIGRMWPIDLHQSYIIGF